MEATTITIVLELERIADCPAGSARVPDGAAREFHGWLGLAEAIDALARSSVGPTPAGTPNRKETP